MTYRAMEVTKPGTFTFVERQLVEPASRQVRIRVEACGVCHSDIATVENQLPGITYPRVPGHEVVGTIEAIGSDVLTWEIGQRVGVGFFGGEDGTCEACRRGDFVQCAHPVTPGLTVDGGYAEIMIAENRALAAIPDGLAAVEAAPLLCAGVTTFNALRNAGLRSGDSVAILGIGGLGHLAIQFASRMGLRTIAIGRAPDEERMVKALGAHTFINGASEDAGAALRRMGGVDAVLATAPSGKAMANVFEGLAIRGKLLVVGIASDPIEVGTIPLVFGGRSILGSLSGTAIDEEDALAFSVLQNVKPMVEVMPLERAREAYERMLSGEARFRMVLKISDQAPAIAASSN